MSEEHEQVFNEEAQEEAILIQDESNQQGEASFSKKHNVWAQAHEADDSGSETSPLISSSENVRMRDKGYARAINEPWHGAHGAEDFPWYKKPSMYWLLPAFFPFCVAFGGIIVPKTYLVLDLLCKEYLSDCAQKDPSFSYIPVHIGDDNNQCRIPEVQSLVSYFNTYSDLLSGIFSAIASPLLGALSDRVGRKKIIVISSAGALVTEVITILVGRYPDQISVYWLLLGCLIDGLCGSFTTGLALAFAYAADCTPPERRAVAFGFFHGSLFAGIALGPIVAGYLISITKDIVAPFYFALACHLFFILFTTFVIPESLSKERQILAQEKHAADQAKLKGQSWLQKMRKINIFEPLWVLYPTGPGSSSALRRNLFVIAAIDTMMFGVSMGTMRILFIYAEYLFGWNAVDSAMFLSVCNVVRVTCLLGLLPLLNRVFRGPLSNASSGHRGSDRLDITIIRVALLLELVGYLGYALAPSGTAMFASGIVAATGGIGSPTLSSSLTKHVPADKTGQVLGASGLLHALARVVAPIVFNLIYAKTVKWYAGFVFICLASLWGLTFILSWFMKPHVFLHDESNPSTEEDETESDPQATRD